MAWSIRHRFVQAAIAFTVLASVRTGHAALIRHKNLLTTALESNAVVRARKVAETPISPYGTRTQLVVEEVYEGAFKPGDALDLDLGSYSFVDPFAALLRPDLEPKDTSHVELVLFLEVKEGGETRGRGARLLRDGYAEDFAQWSNPGGLSPTIQRREPNDIFALFRHPDHEATVDEFDQDLRATLARASAIHRALDEAPSAQRREKLVELIGPRPDSTDGLRYEDREDAACFILDTLEHENDVVGYVEMYSRSRPHDGRYECDLIVGMEYGRIQPASFLAAAKDRALDPLARLAALRLFGRRDDDAFMRADPPVPWQDALPLLDDPEPLVRRGVLDLAFRKGNVPRTFLDRLVDRWSRETDLHVRYALLCRVRELGLLDRVGFDRASLPIIDAGRLDRRLWVTWDDLDADPPWTVADVTLNVHLQAPGAPWTAVPISGPNVQPIDLDVGHGGWKEDLPDAPVWTTGTYETRLSVVLERLGTYARRDMTLGPMTVHLTTDAEDRPPAPARAARTSATHHERWIWLAATSLLLLLGRAIIHWRYRRSARLRG